MIHGAANSFDAIFLTSDDELIKAETLSPYYLTTNYIDVWGIDMAWTMVPMETPDFTFMKDWVMEDDIDHAVASISIARLVRGILRQGFCRMNLLGLSYGGSAVYETASRETQLH